MEKAIEQFTHAGYRVSIYPDYDATSPDEWENDDIFLVANHRDFTVGSKRGIACDINTPKEYRKDYHVLPLYAYIHGGVALSLGRFGQFSDQWDSGQVGWVFVGKRQGFKNIRKAAESLIAEWNQYLCGDVYGYVVERVSDDEVEHVDSCWGFYGLDYAIAEAKTCCEAERTHENKEASKIDAILHL